MHGSLAYCLFFYINLLYLHDLFHETDSGVTVDPIRTCSYTVVGSETNPLLFFLLMAIMSARLVESSMEIQVKH